MNFWWTKYAIIYLYLGQQLFHAKSGYIIFSLHLSFYNQTRKALIVYDAYQVFINFSIVK